MNIDYLRGYIESHEGRRNTIYIDSKGNKTIGIGHKILDGENIRSTLTDGEIDILFDSDAQIHIQRAKNLFPDFEDYPDYVKIAIVDGVFRGDLSGSPKTIALINAGIWEAAAREYLNNRECYESLGIYKRMLENSYHFLCYGKELG